MKSTFELLWLIPFLPLLGALINGMLSLGAARSLNGPSRGFVSLIAVLMPGLSFVLTVIATVRLGHLQGGNVALTQDLWQWFAVSAVGFHFDLTLGLLFDHLTSMMLLFVTGIGTLIHVYSIGYMWSDRGYARFMTYLNLFMFSMITLVIGDSLPATFLGWEGVGLCSYLLIGFWSTNNEYNDAARKAFVVNRIGDLGFLLGAFALYMVLNSDGHGSLNYRDIAVWFQDGTSGRVAAIAAQGGLISAAALLIFFGCTGKSAQIPLVTWLPDAMAGPTPVSALIHAATMVTSGVYLLARLSDLYAHATVTVLGLTPLQWVLVVGCVTAVWGAVAGLVQTDIKKALAYSTVSQLGFMFMAAGVGSFDVALFHVFTHAFFKATLFLAAGSIIHGLHHEQDMRRMGGLARLMPVTYAWFFCGWYAIIGLPFGSGFWSKDLILEHLFDGPGFAPVIGAIATATALLTAIYMTRVMYLTFWSPTRLSAEAKARVHESPASMLVPITILGFGSLVVGVLWAPLPPPYGFGVKFFGDYLAPVVGGAQQVLAAAAATVDGAEHVAHAESVAAVFPWASVIGATAAALGVVLAWAYWRKGPTGALTGDLTGFAARWTWGFDRFYDAVVVAPVKILAFVLAWIVESMLAGIIALVARLVGFMSEGYTSIQRPRLRSSLALSVSGAAVLVAILLLQGPLAIGVAVAGVAVATLYLFLEFFF